MSENSDLYLITWVFVRNSGFVFDKVCLFCRTRSVFEEVGVLEKRGTCS